MENRPFYWEAEEPEQTGALTPASAGSLILCREPLAATYRTAAEQSARLAADCILAVRWASLLSACRSGPRPRGRRGKPALLPTVRRLRRRYEGRRWRDRTADGSRHWVRTEAKPPIHLRCAFG